MSRKVHRASRVARGHPEFIDASVFQVRRPPSRPARTRSLGFYLGNCRFHIEVHWADSRGRTGVGQPVQLTNDTGYFWFFNDANVELMIKVLDARWSTDNFWVFFGALSSVEYTITVVDTFSGALRSYHNPQGAFASVGDTSAFRGGHGVSFQEDTTRSVSGTITATGGGSLSATAADGTAFTLEVPPGAILQDEDITMTPVRESGSFPFAGGLSAGVNLKPAGLLLFEGATLLIHKPSSIARSEETAVAWNGSGEDFYLFPPEPAGTISNSTSSFRRVWSCARKRRRASAQIGREPLDDTDLLSSPKVADAPCRPERRRWRSATPSKSTSRTADWRSNLVATMEDQYHALKVNMETAGEPDSVRSPIVATIRCGNRGLQHWDLLVELVTRWPGRGTRSSRSSRR